MNKKLAHYFDLIKTFAIYSLKEQNVNSYFGLLQFLIAPLLTALVLIFVFSSRVGEGIQHYGFYVLFGMVIWQLFFKSFQESRGIVKSYGGVVKSLNFPSETIVYGNILNLLAIHIFSVFLLVIFMVYFGVGVSWVLWYIPILFFYIIFVSGVSFIIVIVEIYMPYLRNFWGFLLRALWLFTPIFYVLKEGTSHYALNLFNPVFYFVSVSRDVILYQKVPSLFMIFMTIFISLLFFVIGFGIFSFKKKSLAERL